MELYFNSSNQRKCNAVALTGCAHLPWPSRRNSGTSRAGQLGARSGSERPRSGHLPAGFLSPPVAAPRSRRGPRSRLLRLSLLGPHKLEVPSATQPGPATRGDGGGGCCLASGLPAAGCGRSSLSGRDLAIVPCALVSAAVRAGADSGFKFPCRPGFVPVYLINVPPTHVHRRLTREEEHRLDRSAFRNNVSRSRVSCTPRPLLPCFK